MKQTIGPVVGGPETKDDGDQADAVPAAAATHTHGTRERALYRVGYWLPCGQANFHRPGTADRRSDGAHESSYHLIGVPGVGLPQRSLADERRPLLADDLYTRLAYVLTGENGPCVPVHLVKRDGRGRISAAIFAVDALRSTHCQASQILNAIGIQDALIYADEHGFVEVAADVRDTSIDGSFQEAVTRFLGHIFSAVDPGQSDHHLALRNNREGLDKVLADYASGGSFLNFFQLNTILEGLWNSALKPEIFFEQNVVSNTHERNLHSFFELIVTDLSRETCPADLAAFDRLLDSTARLEDLDILIGSKDRTLIMDNFLEATLKDVLLELKWSIETTRRAFLDKTLGILHRRSQLFQIEDPDSPGLALHGVNEVQLRGYLMLVSAKLPLIMNVSRYIKDVLDLLSKRHGEGDLNKEVGLNDQLTQLSATWAALLRAIEENITSLEHAIEASWRDRLLYEEEQSRAEQEALAEIERSRSRAIAGGSEESLVVKLTLAATIAAVSFGVWTTTSRDTGGWEAGLVFVVVALAASYLSVTMFYIAKVRINPPLRHNYEINFRLDRPIKDEDRMSMILGPDGEFGTSADGTAEGKDVGRWWRCEITPDLVATGTPEKPTARRMGSELWPCCLGIEKVGAGSFRIERVDDAECVIKIHCDAEVVWRRLDSTEHLWQRLICRISPPRTALDVIAELLVHRPSAGDEIVLREVRGISVGRRRLTPRDMWEMTAALTQRFINPYLKDDHAIQTSMQREGKDGQPVTLSSSGIDASVRLIAPVRQGDNRQASQPATGAE